MENILKKISTMALIIVATLAFSATCAFAGDWESVFNVAPGEEAAMMRTLDMYDRIPVNIRQKFEDSDWQIQFAPTEYLNAISGVRAGSYTAGVTRFQYHLIIINDRVDCADAICHEIGHWVDSGSLYSRSLDFQRIFAEEGSRYSEYGSIKCEEFFAEIFYGIVMNDGNVANCPEAVQYVQGIINTF